MTEAHARRRRRRAARGHRRRRRATSACRWGRSSSPTPSVSTSACTWGASWPPRSVGPAPDAVAPLVAAGKLGRKTGQGLYEWRDGKAVKPAVDAAAPVSRRPRGPPAPAAAERGDGRAARRRRRRRRPGRRRRDLRLGFRAVPRRPPALCARNAGSPPSSRGWQALASRHGDALPPGPRAGRASAEDLDGACYHSRTIRTEAFMQQRIARTPVELSVLRAFSPLDGLKNENLRALSRKTVVASNCRRAACSSRKATPTSAPTTW